jgi:hypothetical protein
LQAAREALGLANKYLDEFDKMASEMIQKEINDKQFFDIITAVYPKPEKDAKGSMTKWENKIDTLNISTSVNLREHQGYCVGCVQRSHRTP